MDVQVSGDALRVTLASLLRLIDRMGDAALSGRGRDIDEWEREVRSGLFAHLAGVGPAETAAGVALAHTLVEPILKGLRERAQPKTALGEIDLAVLPTMGRLN